MAETGNHSETGLWSRRSWLVRGAWGGLMVTLGIWGLSCIRLLFPRVRYSLPTEVRVGAPQDIPVGTIMDRHKKDHKFVVIRTEAGFFALRTVCTHLGCIPRWQPLDERFRCFCHGSAFARDGRNLAGPAPRPLERLHITLDATGQLVVDTGRRYRPERGGFERPGAFLRYEDARGQDHGTAG